MPRISVPPTRSNLIRLKKELQFAREGYEILDRKREVLTTELIRLAHDAGLLQEQVWKLQAEAYHALERAQLTMGREHVEWAALAANKTVEVHLRFRGIMGVPVPMIEASGGPPQMLYSLGDTSATLDEASTAFRKVLLLLPELSRLVTTVFRLAGELRKTQRRVNALQYIFIPEYEETVALIVSSLEEREREDTFRLKLLKNRMKRSKNNPPAQEGEQPIEEALESHQGQV
jgi:V/A-type H+-transporting ATPase subunit D